jgi:hypothetical protein
MTLLTLLTLLRAQGDEHALDPQYPPDETLARAPVVNARNGEYARAHVRLLQHCGRCGSTSKPTSFTRLGALVDSFLLFPLKCCTTSSTPTTASRIMQPPYPKKTVLQYCSACRCRDILAYWSRSFRCSLTTGKSPLRRHASDRLMQTQCLAFGFKIDLSTVLCMANVDAALVDFACSLHPISRKYVSNRVLA